MKELICLGFTVSVNRHSLVHRQTPNRVTSAAVSVDPLCTCKTGGVRSKGIRGWIPPRGR